MTAKRLFVRLLERIITVSVKSIKSTWTYQKLPDTLFRNFGAYGTEYCKVVIHTKQIIPSDKPHLILDYLLQIIVALLRNSAENAEMLP